MKGDKMKKRQKRIGEFYEKNIDIIVYIVHNTPGFIRSRAANKHKIQSNEWKGLFLWKYKFA